MCTKAPSLEKNWFFPNLEAPSKSGISQNGSHFACSLEITEGKPKKN